MLISPARLQRAGLFACALSLVASVSAVAPAVAAPVARPVPRPVSIPSVPATKTSPGSVRTQSSVAGFSVLHSFTGADGSAPSGAMLEDTAGNFYGTTEAGGASNAGTVFKAAPNGTVTTLHAFSGADGAVPAGGLVNLIGNLDLFGGLYGVTQGGGPNNAGTVYQITTAGTFSTLHAFTGGDGSSPSGRLVRYIDGNLYGTTSGGGATGNGTVFKLTPSGTLTTLHAFTGGADGGNPTAGLSPAIKGWNVNGSLFGVTTNGGTFGGGTVFAISPDGTFTVLYNLAPNTDGAAPAAELIPDLDGNLYGTASGGGAGGAGTIFKITTKGAFTLLYTFPTTAAGTNPSGAVPLARLSLFVNGAIYGTTSFGGDSGVGVVFKLANGGFTVLHSFAGGDGQTPRGQLIADFSGNLYGTAAGGGAANAGTLYALPQ